MKSLPLDNVCNVHKCSSSHLVVSRYCEKLRQDLNRDTSFIMSYGQREETRLDQLYTDTLMELLNDGKESLGFLETLDQLLGDQGIFNPDGEIVYVMGDAGVGKSTLLQKLQNLWSKKELQTDAIFFFKFRCRMFSVFRDAEQISLRDLLFKYNCYPDGDPSDEVFDYILRFPSRVIFTFDGYDEVQEALEGMDVPEVVSPQDLAHPLQLLLSLLSGKLLKGSQKVLTARTGVDFQSKVVKKKVALHGFSPAHLRSYVEMHFQEREQREQVWVQLDASPHLCGLCSTPLFCWIVLKSFRHLHTVHDSFQLPQTCVTLTDIFLLLCEVFLSRSAAPSSPLHRKSARCASETLRGGLATLQAFARLALQGTERSSFMFSREEVAACGLTEDELSLGFLRAGGCGGVDGGGHDDAAAVFEFLHVTLQSFLAALALVLDTEVAGGAILRFFTECSRKRGSSCSPFDFLACGASPPSEKSPFASTEHLQFTNLFLCGLLSKAHTGLTDQLVAPPSLKKKRSVLKSYLSTSVKSHLQGLPLCELPEGKKLHVLPHLLWMLRCIFESGSREIALLTARGITADIIKFGYCNMFSGDCTALNFVLQHRRKLLGVDMDNNNISDYGVKQLRASFSVMTIVR